MQLEKYINKLKAIDQKIRMKATGNREAFAESLGMSKATLQRHLDFLKSYEAPIAYDWVRETYYYTRPIKLNLMIEFIELEEHESNKIAGGTLGLGGDKIFTYLFSQDSKNEPTPCYLRDVG
jgi:predicted DNA-binding transcriptional regulator YafY